MSIRAVRVHAFNDPATIAVEQIDRPDIQPDAALVDVAIASINPVDWKTAEGKFPPIGENELPITLGRDLAGTISALGDGVDGWVSGTRVCAFIGQDRGAQADCVRVTISELARVPDDVSMPVAGALPLAAMTAWQGLFDHGGLKEGQRVLIHGAAGGVGHLAVQFAAWKKCEIFATCSVDDLEYVRSLGAARPIDYRNERFEDIAHDLDLVFDTQGADVQARSFGTLKKGGMLVSTLDPDAEKAAAMGVRTVPRWHAEPDAEALERVLALVADGTVTVEIARSFALDEVREAYRYTREDHPRGKVIFTCD